MIGPLPPPPMPQIRDIDDVRLWAVALWQWHSEMTPWFKMLQTLLNDALQSAQDATIADLTVTGNSAITGNETVTGTLAVTGASTLTGTVTVANELDLDGDINHDGTNIGVFGSTPVPQPTVTGIRDSNTALADLLSKLEAFGWIIDSTTAT